MAYDLVVIGAGPAGSSAARIAAKAGLKVALIDKKKNPGTPKECAEGINRESFSFLNLKVRKEWISNTIDSCFCSTLGSGSIYIKRPGARGFILERKKFDLDLAYMAADAGAELVTGIKAVGLSNNNRSVILRGGKALQTSLIVAADGPFSSVARMIGSETVKNGVGMQYEIKGEFHHPHSLHAYIGRKVIPRGWGWVFPKKDTLNVGVGSFHATNLKKYLDSLVKSLGVKGKILEVNGGLIPLHGPLKNIYHDNIMFAGDAAGHANPVSGGGIPAAIFDGQLAGRIASEESEKEQPNLSRYQSEWEKSIWKPSMDISLKIKKVFLRSLDRGYFDYFFDHIGNVSVDRKRDLFKLLQSVPNIRVAFDFLYMGLKFYKPYRYAW